MIFGSALSQDGEIPCYASACQRGFKPQPDSREASLRHDVPYLVACMPQALCCLHACGMTPGAIQGPTEPSEHRGARNTNGPLRRATRVREDGDLVLSDWPFRTGGSPRCQSHR